MDKKISGMIILGIVLLVAFAFFSNQNKPQSVVNLDNQVIVTIDKQYQGGFERLDSANFDVLIDDDTVALLKGASLNKAKTVISYDSYRDAKVYCVNGEPNSGATGSLYSFSKKDLVSSQIKNFEIKGNRVVVYTNISNSISHVYHPERCEVYNGIVVNAVLVFDKAPVIVPSVPILPNTPSTTTSGNVSGSGTSPFLVVLAGVLFVIGLFWFWSKR